MHLPDDKRILEIGREKLFARLAPERTDHFTAFLSRTYNPGEVPLRPRDWSRVRNDLARGKYGLVSLGAVGVSPWNPDHSLPMRLNRLFRHVTRPVSLAPYVALRWARACGVPVIGFDTLDTMLVAQPNFHFLPHVRCFFKRELPQNNWHAFLGTTRRNGDVSNIRRQPFFQSAVAKLRPLPLYIQADPPHFPPVSAADKTTDIFYVGDNPKTTVRMNGLRQLEALRGQGVVVDIPTERLSREEFYRRLSKSWLAWSPEGSGWECHRHYESLVHGAVPVMNYPTIDRYRPLIENVHGLYYGVEGDNLSAVVRASLQNKENLLRMVDAGRKHLQQFYTPRAIADYLLSQV